MSVCLSAACVVQNRKMLNHNTFVVEVQKLDKIRQNAKVKCEQVLDEISIFNLHLTKRLHLLGDIALKFVARLCIVEYKQILT